MGACTSIIQTQKRKYKVVSHSLLTVPVPCNAVDYLIDPSQRTRIQVGLFSVPTSGSQLVHQRLWYVLPVCGKVHIKDPLPLI